MNGQLVGLSFYTHPHESTHETIKMYTNLWKFTTKLRSVMILRQLRVLGKLN